MVFDEIKLAPTFKKAHSESAKVLNQQIYVHCKTSTCLLQGRDRVILSKMQAFEVARKIFSKSAKDSLDKKSRAKTEEV